jgi:hypothetical protein
LTNQLSPPYPWYTLISEDDEIQQGDLLEHCPVFKLPADPDLDGTAKIEWVPRDLVVMSQSCDLVKGRAKVEEVLLCAVWRRSEVAGKSPFTTPKGFEDARRGNLPGFHLLAECSLPGFERELRVVDFRRLYSLPIAYVRHKLEIAPHLRLLSPYREHLSQAFARTFMRVGLPVDIPPFC